MKKGFTLLELLIISGIISIMTGVVLVSVWESRPDKELEVSMRTVAAVARQAQNNALNGRQLEQAKIPCTFSISFASATQYVMEYAYHSEGDATCDSTETIAAYDVTGGVTVGDFGSVTFDIPHGTVAPANTTITLTHDGNTALVCIYPSGRIEEFFNATSC